ncbi:outer membrane protein assembly factor [Algibacter amylolyticus]|uniref:Outer membrane protein assembly factor n=1 Tax=Algibacter amylolyticus TaxID=1608400 RepID=A0A5M7BER7_9FLAO|nr:outer membrane protein assembly factor [Algibacter amylolyticus]KAA5828056.1 outer membrane protein assembly factor [Algibacter amylolyticus]MBB5267304.1 outer membrane protein assembly factor BamA [Algibacter amylolyticus]TSJ82301.1 outer membrane protein assembly factor [Algibacter amylolyticus]
MKKQLVLLIILGFVSLGIYAQELLVQDLKVQGNKRLKTTFIKSISTIKAGAALDSAVIKQDIIRLKRLPSVAHVYFQVFPAEDNQYNVFYNIEENFTLIPSANIYTTNDDEFAYRLGLYEFNLLGRSIAFGAFYQKDIYSSYALNFRAPFLFSNKAGLAVNLQDLTTQEPVFFQDETANYKYRNKSIEALGLYQFNFTNRLELGFNYFVEDYKFKGENVNNRPELNVNKWLVKGIYEYNNLDYCYQYISGFKSQFNFQYVTSTNDMLTDFFIGWNDFFLFKRVGEKGNWANRLRMGLATNNETPFAPFSVDNNLNVRGVGNTIDRGTGVIVLNTEYRQTLFEKDWFVLQGNAFVDAGSWRNPGGEVNDFTNSENVKVYPGLGLRFMHKKIYNAIFRIDYGYGISKNATKGFVFGIGQYF